jgi:hypothetical protein
MCASDRRRRSRQIDAGSFDDAKRFEVSTFIEQAGLLGTGDYAFPNPRELSDNYAILASFQIAKPVELGAPLRIFPLVGGVGASRRAPLYLDAGRLSPYSRRP